MKVLAVVAALAGVAGASACMWDSDTLAMEAKGLPDVVRVISGRFERNPPLYYEMRLDRVAGEIKTKPNDLALYDDAGVACARLGRNDEAIAWMAKKLKVLQIDKARGKGDTEHWYRYHANLGTFMIHRWLHDGCPKSRLAEARAARDHIAKAVEINPDAHFGREHVQLAAMDAIIAIKIGVAKEFDLQLYDKRSKERLVEGTCGLIVLGAAWESVDMFDALAKVLSANHKAAVAYLAVLRRNELLDEGKKPLAGTADQMRQDHADSHPWMVHEGEKPGIERDFKMLRDDAKAYERKRTAYMMVRLKAGRHPDSDRTFWSDWKEPPMPVLRDPFYVKYRTPILLVSLVLAGVLLLVLNDWRKRRRRRLPPPIPPTTPIP